MTFAGNHRWRRAYRFRHRPHVLLVADPDTLHTMQDFLQADWLLSGACSLDEGWMLAKILSPACVVLNERVGENRQGLAIERLRRDPLTCNLPLLFLANTNDAAEAALTCGVTEALIAPVAMEKIHAALLRLRKLAH